jgi:hypothetical protein
MHLQCLKIKAMKTLLSQIEKRLEEENWKEVKEVYLL